MADAVIAEYGGIDILVNHAALMVDAPFIRAADVAPDDWDRLMAVNMTGALDCVQASVGPLLLPCSDAGGWITGQVLHNDGGWIIRP